MEIVLRASVIFFFVWILLRSLGKRELSSLTAFELVLVIVIGDLVQQGITQEDYSVTGAMLSVGTIAVWILATSYLSFRFKRTRPVLEGTPSIIIVDGRMSEDSMHIERLTEEEILDAAREQGIGDLADVRIGLLEADGRFTFIKREESSSPQRNPGEERSP